MQAAARARWRAQRSRRPWLDHLAHGYRRYKSVNGDHLAAAITYFSFLALFPMLLLAVSIAGYVLARRPDLFASLQKTITDNVPGAVGTQLKDVLTTSLNARGTIGLVGLVGVAYAGLGWIANLRKSIQIVWSCEPVEENPIKAKAEDLLALIGLGLGILVSLMLTAGGTAVAGKVIEWVGLDGTPGLGTALAGLSILLAVATDTLIFGWLFSRLPRRPVRFSSVLRGAIFAAVGYEAIKLIGTFYLARVGANGVYGTFAGIVGLMIWINLVSRFLLFAAAWTATAPQPPFTDARADGEPAPGVG